MTFCVIVNYINTESLKLLSKRQKFRLFQIESICKRQNKSTCRSNLKTEILLGMGRKH